VNSDSLLRKEDEDEFKEFHIALEPNLKVGDRNRRDRRGFKAFFDRKNQVRELVESVRD
jgi:hypothetical protein